MPDNNTRTNETRSVSRRQREEGDSRERRQQREETAERERERSQRASVSHTGYCSTAYIHS